MDSIEQAIDDMLTAAAVLATRREVEIKLEDERPAEKRAAMLRIIGGENPLTGKAHSASSAEAVVETDMAYAAYRVQQRDAVTEVIMARAHYEAALFRCRALTSDRVTVGAAA